VAQAGGQRRTTITNANGQYTINGLPSGPMSVTGSLPGFKTVERSIVYDQQPRQIDLQLMVGELTETVNVSGDAPLVNTASAEVVHVIRPDALLGRTNAQAQSSRREERNAAQAEPSVNVQNLQRRAAGVLPVRIDVPRAGISHRFIRPLVIDEEMGLSFRYKRR
jgi:hypothetical protein